LALDDDIEVTAIADSRPIGSVVSISRASRAHSPSGVASDSSISIPTSAGMSPEDEAAIAALMADDMKAVDEIRLIQILEGVDAQNQLEQAAAKGDVLAVEVKSRLDAKIKTGTALIQSLDWLQAAQLIKMAIDLGVDLNSSVVIYPLMARYLDLMRDASTQAQIRETFFKKP
jgi:hypothetical protein